MASVKEIGEENQWTNIREGLKLKQVINSKKINEAAAYISDIDM